MQGSPTPPGVQPTAAVPAESPDMTRITHCVRVITLPPVRTSRPEHQTASTLMDVNLRRQSRNTRYVAAKHADSQAFLCSGKFKQSDKCDRTCLTSKKVARFNNGCPARPGNQARFQIVPAVSGSSSLLGNRAFDFRLLKLLRSKYNHYPAFRGFSSKAEDVLDNALPR